MATVTLPAQGTGNTTPAVQVDSVGSAQSDTAGAAVQLVELTGVSAGGALTRVAATASGLKVDGSATTQPVSAASLPLPAGAATAARQDAQTALLGGGLPSTLATDRLKVDGSGVTQPVSAASLPLPTGAAQDATLATTNTEVGPTNETAPASDTAASGLNGRLQRIAQRLTSLIALLPTALGAGGGLKIDGSGTALPVSGTVAATQSGTWTVQPGNTANTTAWKVDGSAVTQPVSGTVTTSPPANASTNVAQIAGTTADTNSGTKSAGTLRVVIATDQPALTNALKVDPSGVTSPISAASLPLPTGAATSAKQPALGTAGTPSSDVLSVQGVTSGTPVTVVDPQTMIQVTPTVSSSPAYSSGDAMGGLMDFANAARVSGGSGIILGVTIMCKTPALAWTGLELVIFDRSVTVASDNAANAFSDSDAAFIVAVVKLSDWIDYTNQSVVSRQVQVPFKANGTDLFAQLVTRSAVTLGSSSDIVVRLDIEQN